MVIELRGAKATKAALVTDVEENSKPRIQSVARAAAILEVVAASPKGLTPREVSDATGIRLATAYHLLQTLAAVDLLRRDATGSRYLMGFGVGSLAAGFERHVSAPEQLFQVVRSVADATGEAVYGSGWADGDIVILARAAGTKPVSVAELPVGMAGHAYARASGKVLLALSDPADRDAYLGRHEHVALTPNTWTREELLERLPAIREQGYALDDEEHSEGVCCVSAPIGIGAQTFCVTLSAPADRFRANQAMLIDAVVAAARRGGHAPLDLTI